MTRLVNIAYGAGHYWAVTANWKELADNRPLSDGIATGDRGFRQARAEAVARGFRPNAEGEVESLYRAILAALKPL